MEHLPLREFHTFQNDRFRITQGVTGSHVFRADSRDVARANFFLILSRLLACI